MNKTVKMTLADGTEHGVSFRATGTTQIRYRMIFRKELMKSLASVAKSMSATDESDGLETLENMDSDGLSVIGELAYIMNLQAEGGDFSEASYDSYLEWLDQFDSMEMITHAPEIIEAYISSRATTSKAKKKNVQPTGK